MSKQTELMKQLDEFYEDATSAEINFDWKQSTRTRIIKHHQQAITKLFLESLPEKYGKFQDTPVVYPTGNEIIAWKDGCNYMLDQITKEFKGDN